MSFSDNETNQDSNFSGKILQRIGQLSQRTWAVILAILAFVILYSFVQPNRPLKPVVDAGAYNWPKGCPNINYRYAYSRGENIPCACAEEKFRINDWIERGLRDSKKGPDSWYRVGNYAINIYRGDGLFGNKKCYFGNDPILFYFQSKYAEDDKVNVQ